MHDEHDQEQVYYHDHGDGHVHVHSVMHEHEHSHEFPHEHTAVASDENSAAVHAHGHVHTQTKAVINRLSRAIGHLESVKRMVEDGRDCSEVLIQLAAVRSELNNTAKVILKDHLEHCLTHVSEGDIGQLQDLNDAIDRFLN